MARPHPRSMNSGFQRWDVEVHIKLPLDSGAASLALLKGLASESHGAVLDDICPSHGMESPCTGGAGATEF